MAISGSCRHVMELVDSKTNYEYTITYKHVMSFIASDQARPWGAPQSPELWGSPRDGQLQAVKAISSAPKARPPSTGQLPSEGLSRKGKHVKITSKFSEFMSPALFKYTNIICQ